MSNAKQTITLIDVLEFVHSASKEDRTVIGQALIACRNEDILTARMEFKVGDKVKFEVRKRGWPQVVRGVITRKNIKTIHVRPTLGGREWKVTASLLQRDEE